MNNEAFLNILKKIKLDIYNINNRINKLEKSIEANQIIILQHITTILLKMNNKDEKDNIFNIK